MIKSEQSSARMVYHFGFWIEKIKRTLYSVRFGDRSKMLWQQQQQPQHVDVYMEVWAGDAIHSQSNDTFLF